MANISKISAQVAANSSQFDSTIDKVNKRLAKLQSNSKDMGSKASSAVSNSVEKIQSSLHNVTPSKGGMGEIFNKKNVQGAGSELSTLKSSIMSVKGAFGALLAVAAAVGLGMAAKFVYQVVVSTLETQKLAKQLGSTTTALMGFQFAAKGVGVDVDTANQAISELVGLIAKANSGDIAALDIFKRLGLSVAELSKLTPTEAFGKVADAINGFGTASQRAAVLTQLFGDKASSLAPLIAKGSQGLESAAAKARKLGLAISDVKLDQMRQGKIAFEQLGEALNGIALMAAAELAPTIIAIVNAISRGVNESQDMGNAFGYIRDEIKLTYMSALLFVQAIRAIAIVMKLSLIQTGVILGYLVSKFLMLYRVILQVGKALMWLGGASAPMKTMIKSLDNVLKKLDQANGHLKDAREKAADDLESLMDEVKDTNMGQMDRDIERLKKAANSQSDAAKDLDKTINETFKQSQTNLAQKGLEVTRENATPLEKYRSHLKELDQMLKSGSITWQTYSRAVGKAAMELENANNASNISLPTLARGNTSEAISAVNKARNEQQFKTNESPQDRLNRIQQQALLVQQRQEKYQEEIARAVNDQKVYEIN